MATATSETEPANGQRTRKPTILLVEDEEGIREMIRISLELEDYSVLDTPSPHEALNLWNQWSERIDLLITDSGTPGMPGAQLAEMLMERKPELKVLFATGFASGRILDMEKTRRNVRLLKKPYPIRRLVETVSALLEVRKRP